MLGIVWVAAVALVATTAAGVVLLAALPRWLRAVLVPAAPAVGLTGVVVTMTWLHLLVPARVAGLVVWLVVLGAGAALAVRARHRLPSRRGWRQLAVVLALGVVLALPALAPSLRAGTAWVVQPSTNNDAVWHVGMAEWFLDHPAGERPDVQMAGEGDEGPFVWPTVLAIDDGMRRGEPLLHGALSVLTGQRPMAAWSPLTATWVALLPGSLLAGLRLLGASRGAARAGALVGASSAVLAAQVFWQHGPSVVAMCAPLPVALGLTWIAARHRAAAVAAGVAWAGVVTLYNELLPLYAPAALALVAGRVLLGRRARPHAAARRVARRRVAVALGMAVGVAAVAAAPTLVGVVGYLRQLAAEPTVSGSPYDGAGPLAGALRMAGLLPLQAPPPARTVQLALLASAVGLLVVLVAQALPSWRAPRARALRLATVVLAVSVVVAAVAAHQRGEVYSTKRVVDTGLPLAFALGAATLADGVRTRRARPWAPILGGVALGAFVVANATSGWRSGDVADLDQRTVDADLRAVATMVRDHDPDGAGVLVAVGSYFDEHWLGLLLVDRPQVAYPVIGPGYVPGLRYGRMDGVEQVVVDDEVVAALPAGEVAGRFEVADVAGRDWAVLQFGAGWWSTEQGPEGPARWMADQGALVVTGHDLGCGVPVTFAMAQPTTLTRHIPGIDDVAIVVDDDQVVADLVLPAVPIVDLVLVADPPAVTGVGGDGRALSVRVTAVDPPPPCGPA